jgi:hypothetical protein
MAGSWICAMLHSAKSQICAQIAGRLKLRVKPWTRSQTPKYGLTLSQVVHVVDSLTPIFWLLQTWNWSGSGFGSGLKIRPAIWAMWPNAEFFWKYLCWSILVANDQFYPMWHQEFFYPQFFHADMGDITNFLASIVNGYGKQFILLICKYFLIHLLAILIGRLPTSASNKIPRPLIMPKIFSNHGDCELHSAESWICIMWRGTTFFEIF